jgi:hypothetical protein
MSKTDDSINELRFIYHLMGMVKDGTYVIRDTDYLAYHFQVSVKRHNFIIRGLGRGDVLHSRIAKKAEGGTGTAFVQGKNFDQAYDHLNEVLAATNDFFAKFVI